MTELSIKNLEEINSVAKQFIELVGERRVFAMYGAMGVGKTTFVKAVCEVLGVEDTINSPTFAIVNEYHTPKDKIVYHFDFYRIDDVQEAYDFGYEDYFYSKALCFIEWPERIESILPADVINLNFTEKEDGTRIIQVEMN
ncbi:tRNA (adenosine(37)-N6)-threonylcarbamoyltransferase complex ATPase subunit type 1 TsaE [Ancylomarina euxinus]|uniref:tRNA threonylcarbamoyladenosine biosynthesis protein TsaE n=1 Tax=Ancylomarina euxinus TaxID=2283627 RepID=A0A425XZR0_9BACT|nr:tRNA (adenosine(37)-N6)-threonylcarbamoyltransferase complex ATPase subunit type 1 TsaE [Ancylomarina euxinus]MCZ4695509.1 tRNA (adenosine(37)-N6)-threonylcarbamoyltransferase complex ATPase subunit type 1 TsaE [Ancylomarina euxinus]MUP15673.1 tRNA (adenosine(37)-N6)-threonylcarbamoyltransferase complex ATPase subunit type 1 TsaE [Ancylomarina euxinus]RRG20666.1 tRNA (adenosine(37)-N6)-threonylcarbamoyltransferase complex ATPase subunit type 1 TsaE [Ancylomarina euxinus]